MTAKSLWTAIAALLLFGLPGIIQGQQVTPSVQLLPSGSDLDIRVGLTHLPRESPANPAVQSSTWVAAANNAVSIILGGLQSTGSNQFDTASRSGTLDYLRMITSTAFQSWSGVPHTPASGNNQFGNRAHFPVTVTSAKSGVTFLLADITQTVRSYTRTSAGWTPDGAVNTTATLNTLNSTRLRLQPGGVPGVIGDIIHSVQDAQAQSQSAAFVGIGVALGAFGSGDSATQLNNTLNYYMNGNFAVQVTVNVPYTDNGVAKVANGSTVFISGGIHPGSEERYPSTQLYQTRLSPDQTRVNLSLGSGGTVSPNNLFLLQVSTNLVNWQGIGYPSQFGGQTTLTFPTGEMPGGNSSRCFYRVVDLLPPTGVAARIAPRSAPSGGAPKVDITVP